MNMCYSFLFLFLLLACDTTTITKSNLKGLDEKFPIVHMVILNKDENYLNLKQMGGMLLSGPPATYHFTIE